MITLVKQFLEDKNAWEAYVTGRAGTGKTTGLAESVQYCINTGIPYLVLAYTHDACRILRSKLPTNAAVMTLHAWLKKRPGINQDATKQQHIQVNVKTANSTRPRIVFIDEYSMVGEKDLMDIRSEQDNNYDGIPDIKVCWLGDPYQLPPVGDAESVRPSGKYAMTLTKQWRRAEDNPLSSVVEELVAFIEGSKTPVPLEPNKSFIRGRDLDIEYLSDTTGDCILLAYTNKRVQALNALMQGYDEPRIGDPVFSPTTKQTYLYGKVVENPTYVDLPFGEQLHLGSKYKTLEYLLDTNLAQVVELIDADGDVKQVAHVFGHSEHKINHKELANEAAKANREIESTFKGVKAAGWAKANYTHKLARRRSKAWRDFLTYNECVVCLDFTHAKTVHKSQGSTYTNVYLDTEDLGLAADNDFTMYLRLMYVAISRARNKVVTN